MTHRVYFYYGQDYQGYVADALDLPGCVSQGKTLEEAKQNIKDAIKAYIETEQKSQPKNALIGYLKLPTSPIRHDQNPKWQPFGRFEILIGGNHLWQGGDSVQRRNWR